MKKFSKKNQTIGLIFLCFVVFNNFMWFDHSKPKWAGTIPQMIRIGYQVNPNFTPKNNLTQAQQLTSIQNAANIWFEQGYSNFQFEYQGQAGSTGPRPDCPAPVGRVNSIFAETAPNPDVPTGVLAIAEVYHCQNSAIINHFEIRFNDRDHTWTQQMIQEVAAHEFGHAPWAGSLWSFRNTARMCFPSPRD